MSTSTVMDVLGHIYVRASTQMGALDAALFKLETTDYKPIGAVIVCRDFNHSALRWLWRVTTVRKEATRYDGQNL